MRLERGLIFWSTGGLATGLLAASVWAQPPVPPTGPAPGGVPCVTCERSGPLRRAFHHTFHVVQDNMIGYPSEFVEPPHGFYVNETRAIMRAKADTHRFTLYQTDFLAGSNRLSPIGASRFNAMVPRLRSWPGAVQIEWSPEKPGLAEARKEMVVALLQGQGLPIIPERVVIGPSPYPGSMGTDALNNYNILINRDQQAPATYSVSPSSAGTFGSGSGGNP